MAWFTKNKKKSVSKQNKTIGATITPAFTADRAFVYLVGGAASLAGLYVIYTLIKKGLDGEQDSEKKKVNEATQTDSNADAQINIPTRAFPIRYEGFNPPYRSEVAELQALLLQAGQPLPIYGVDGKFGPETLSAVQNQFANNYKTQVERGEFIALQQIANLKNRSIAGLGLAGLEKTEKPMLIEPSKHYPLFNGLGCGCQKCA